MSADRVNSWKGKIFVVIVCADGTPALFVPRNMLRLDEDEDDDPLVVGVMSGVLYGAAVVGTAVVCAATVGAATVGVTCALTGASNRACMAQCRIVLSRDTQSDVCGIKRDGVRR